MITDIENRLLTLDSIRWANRRENHDYSGGSVLPAVHCDYAYSADGQTPVSNQQDVFNLLLTTVASDQPVGSEDIDAHLALDREIAGVLDGWQQPAQTNQESVMRWRRVSGGDVSRDSGYCQSVIRYRRQVMRSACE